MALSDADLDAAWTKAGSKNGPQWVPYFEALRAVAAEARRDALEEAEKKCELVAQRWSHHMVAPSANSRRIPNEQP